jgi:acetyl/propionyl-CoA carboxylase alpha subunit
MKIKKLLIANRGEIACRIARTCRNMGIKTVTLYTEKETDYPHRFAGDESHALGDGALKQTYLNQDLILTIARETGCQAIHPGYGFLSENSLFAKKVRDAGLIFVGPTPEAIDLMGDKIGSKKKVESLGIPLLPGFHGEAQDEEQLKREALKIGFPLLIKASAGGGGKGMRIVWQEKEFAEQLAGARREAQNAFGSDRVLLERFIQNPRHIEIQVFGDQHKNCVYLYERECSIQRRYQKIVEEAPSTALDQLTREKMGRDAVTICREINYQGAGTVEFIFEETPQGKKYYFLEMNTRLQVEHPVTEKITGLDLVYWQLLVASGEKLPLRQEEVVARGHALEVRLYAENPYQEFLPTTGLIKKVGRLDDPDTRLDTGVWEGVEMGIDFDPMMAKVIAFGATRALAISKLIEALENLPYFGMVTNRRYLMDVLGHADFHAGKTTTRFVPDHPELLKDEVSELEQVIALFASQQLSAGANGVGASSNEQVNTTVWHHLQGYQL